MAEKTVEIRAALPEKIHKLLKQEAVGKNLHLKDFVVIIITEHVNENIRKLSLCS